ncbi:cbb3-type cytochrome c oxidase subunit 3 [Rhodoferax sp. TS-BS-61-7]|jgi:cytochrome c oxidase cbb3-type subunit 4|nr:cbb3-type cytochrome c oxidase subunit 3 [Rhodoferax sp. TS-BS-61-7]PQA78727.1 CcoQ/FixQ family Cbb3-type cytochrome c oxidase assembly chaperone [Rhodoferax sp. TS-BS-61-7]
MDINTLRSVTTVVSLLVFVGIVWWAWSKRRSGDFAQAANLPFEQD